MTADGAGRMENSTMLRFYLKVGVCAVLAFTLSIAVVVFLGD